MQINLEKAANKNKSDLKLKMKKAELVELCIQMKLKKSGTKDELIERISNFEEPPANLFEIRFFNYNNRNY